MAVLVTPLNLQKIEFDVTTAEGPSRVTIVTGTMQISLQAASSGQPVIQRNSFKVLLDPALPPGKFRRATADASFGALVLTGAPPNTLSWVIEDAQATFDDEAGRVQLVVDVSVAVQGTATTAEVRTSKFEVSTLAVV